MLEILLGGAKVEIFIYQIFHLVVDQIPGPSRNFKISWHHPMAHFRANAIMCMVL